MKKNIGKSIVTVGLMCLALSSCSLFKNKDNKEENKQVSVDKRQTYRSKKTSVKKDKTTEVLVDAEIKKEDIVKVVKHGDHWHVFTKDGREKITYKDPALLKDNDDFELVSVVGKNKLKDKNVVAIKKHGDHWHVYLADGSEYLTYEDPSALFPNIRVGTYTGSHAPSRAKTTRKTNKANIGEDKVVKILKHGDHYHIYTASGKEYISYEDPSAMYPGIKIGIYQGSHGDDKKKGPSAKDKPAYKNQANKKVQNQKSSKADRIKDLNIAGVLGQGEVDRYDIVKILRHGDHWHIYDSKGNEGIVYEDPKDLYPKATRGEYQGSHGKNTQKDQDQKEGSKNEAPKKEDSKKDENSKKTHKVIKILKHGDHWHIYTADGKEYISYTDPSASYPGVEIGIYEGSHDKTHEEDSKKEEAKKEKPQENRPAFGELGPDKDKKEKPDYQDPKQKEENRLEKIKKLKITGILGQEEVDRFDIVKILKHEDHYHIYDSKGNEGIVYESPLSLYPKASFGHYEGSHGKEDKKEDKKWPEGITKIIDHGDHWHLYKGDKEVAIVKENPKSHYPDAEYIKEGSDHSDIGVEKDEIFSYESVRPRKAEGIEAVLTNNLRAMENFGQIRDGRPVFGTQEKGGNLFYWLHGDHYHALSIKDLIRMEKAGEFGDYTARDVVAALKYKFENPEEDLEYKADLDIREVIDYLKSYYGISDPSRIMNIGLETVYIYTKDESVSFHISEFEKKDGLISYKKGSLPEILSDKELEDLENKDSEEIDQDEPENKDDKQEDSDKEEGEESKEEGKEEGSPKIEKKDPKKKQEENQNPKKEETKAKYLKNQDEEKVKEEKEEVLEESKDK